MCSLKAPCKASTPMRHGVAVSPMRCRSQGRSAFLKEIRIYDDFRALASKRAFIGLVACMHKEQGAPAGKVYLCNRNCVLTSTAGRCSITVSIRACQMVQSACPGWTHVIRVRFPASANFPFVFVLRYGGRTSYVAQSPLLMCCCCYLVLS